jgi:hypothetical protein
MLSEFEVELTVVFAFFAFRRRDDYCRSFQFSNKQGLSIGSSDEKKCLARRLRSEARVKSGEEHDEAPAI